jgi:hypothetical protein
VGPLSIKTDDNRFATKLLELAEVEGVKTTPRDLHELLHAFLKDLPKCFNAAVSTAVVIFDHL